MYNIDPLGYVSFKGIQVPTILDHRTSHLLGLGNNHGDIAHWYPKFGKTMETARKDVAALLQGQEITTVTYEPIQSYAILRRGSKGEDVKQLQTLLLKLGYDLGKWGVDGDFGATTEKKVKEFQAKMNLTADGIVGISTWQALNSIEVEKTYCATIKNLTLEAAQQLQKEYPQCIINEE